MCRVAMAPAATVVATVLFLCIPASFAAPKNNNGNGNKSSQFPDARYIWYDYPLHPQARAVYVSNDGSDANDGLSADSAVASLQAGLEKLRHGEGDHLRLRRGDVFETTHVYIKAGGRDANWPTVIEPYGDGAPPVVKAEFWVNGSGKTPLDLQHVVIDRIHFDGRRANGDHAKNAILFLGDRGRGFLTVRGCRIQHYVLAFNIQHAFNITIDRCLVFDTYARPEPNYSHSQGLFAHEVHGLRITNSVFDRTGWSPYFEHANQTIFNHALYIQYTCSDVVIEGNVICRPSSHGVQLRPGGTFRGNVIVDAPLPILTGYEGEENNNPTIVEDNLVIGSNTIDGEPRGYNESHDQPLIRRNLIVEHGLDPDQYNIRVWNFTAPGAQWIGNISYNWHSARYDRHLTGETPFDVKNLYFDFQSSLRDQILGTDFYQLLRAIDTDDMPESLARRLISEARRLVPDE